MLTVNNTNATRIVTKACETSPNTLYFKILKTEFLDNVPNGGALRCQFACYLTRAKWIEEPTKNIIVLTAADGMHLDGRFEVPYNLTDGVATPVNINGVDVPRLEVPVVIYQGLIARLKEEYPFLQDSDFVIELT